MGDLGELEQHLKRLQKHYSQMTDGGARYKEEARCGRIGVEAEAAVAFSEKGAAIFDAAREGAELRTAGDAFLKALVERVRATPEDGLFEDVIVCMLCGAAAERWDDEPEHDPDEACGRFRAALAGKGGTP